MNLLCGQGSAADFDRWFMKKTEPKHRGSTLLCGRLSAQAKDLQLIEACGGTAAAEVFITTLTEMCAVMRCPPEEGYRDGHANIFFIRDCDGELRTVALFWWMMPELKECRWYFHIGRDRGLEGCLWEEGGRVFLRESLRSIP
jgi:hypothetical protein